MEYRILGKTGIKVSAIGIGGEGFENKSYQCATCGLYFVERYLF